MKYFLILTFTLLVSACVFEKSSIKINKNRKTAGAVSSISIVNNQVIVSGNNLSAVSGLKINGASFSELFTIESKSATQIIANANRAFSFDITKIFELVLSDANGSVTFPISFDLGDGSVTAPKLNSMGALAGQYLKYNGTAWGASSVVDTQMYLGTWNATTNTPDLTLPSTLSGDYYVATVGGTFGGVAYAVGDWIISDGYSWQKIPYSKTSVSSFQGRKGIVTLVPGDYVSLKDTVTSKITGSKLSDIADIDLATLTDGQVLKWNLASSKWLPANDLSGSAGIALTDLSASSPLSYNSGTGVFSLPTANVLALPLTGLATGTGAVAATDSILGAFGKLLNAQSDYVSKSAGATIATGTIAVSGTGMITIPTATGVTATEATNVTQNFRSMVAMLF